MPFAPNKDRHYGTTADVISRLFKECGGVPKVMELLELSRTRTYALADPDDPAEISYSRVVALTKAGGTAAAQHLASLAGGTFLPVAGDEDEGADWHSLAADAARKSAALTAELLESIGPDGHSPGEVDDKEARTLLAHVDALMVVLGQQHALLAARLDGESA